METTYVIVGDESCKAYEENQVQGLVDFRMRSSFCEVLRIDEKWTMKDLLNAVAGMGRYITISEQEYNEFRDLLIESMETKVRKAQKPTYVVLGTEAVNAYELLGVKGLIQYSSADTYDVVKFDDQHSPADIIDATMGWDAYCVITEQEYNEFKKG